ncbi:monooxygenase [Mytilinidion resinicola]|uniref:L-ornithine N(5)-monooxygenase [NAD(P)H] n=1 Tax=Mytilinidion resinicola TaxID=574789 RepID=A0A6A6YPM4_9PEZI|nr:monooxygenase [Mytilinidion resinicola]KAF2810832.1 monooxygenase [Mytilinidion resinicola]
MSSPPEHRFCIITGTGFAGIIAACTFLRTRTLSYSDFLLIDRNTNYGGVWWSNTYPGAACDIHSQIYSISWAPSPFWERYFGSRNEIQAYLEGVARRYQLERSTRFGVEIEEARWDEDELLWVVDTRDVATGTKKRRTCNLLISTAGQFQTPKRLSLPFSTLSPTSDSPSHPLFHQWHTSSWPSHATATLTNARVAIIGTGPSAAQLIPKIYPLVKSLVIYQRSPSFCVPRNDFKMSEWRKWVFARVPGVLRGWRGWLGFIGGIVSRRIFDPTSRLHKAAISIANTHLDNQVHDPVTREKLRPHDPFGCKRPLILDDYYPVFNEPNVTLVTDPVVRLGSHGIVSRRKEDGEEEEREIDVLIWGTGYTPNLPGSAFPCYGVGSRLLAESYQPEGYSLYGVGAAGFPNFLNFLGPNSINFERSMIELLEKQAEYFVQVAAWLKGRTRRGDRVAVMPREEVAKAWTESLREGQRKHPAAGETCQSYYKLPSGAIYYYPYRMSTYYRLIRRPDF